MDKEIKGMRMQDINKILKKPKSENHSLKFHRYAILPDRVKRNIQIAHLLETGNLDWFEKTMNFFDSLTEKEYINYLKLQ